MSQNRSIFQDVTETAPKPVTTINVRSDKPVLYWLLGLFALVCIMIVVGGLTRLTDSGLSITEWNLVFGTLPPMNDTDWAGYFAKYQETQEFALQNATMTLEQFKRIFWWEWGHRLLGRVIGLVWILGFFLFWLRKSIRRDRIRSIFLVGVLIGLQGVIGIVMVKTGYFGDRVDVASYALATHLGMAFVIVGLICWNIKMLSRSQPKLVEARRRGDYRRVSFAKLLLGLTFLQIILGALVAGIDGGLSYNDWPLMGGEFFSSDAFLMTPIWHNFFENSALVQFMHRMNGYLLAVLGVYLLIREWHAPYKQWRFFSRHFALAIGIQIVIGIITLVKMVPTSWAISHQIVAVGVFVLAVVMVFGYRYPRTQLVRKS